MNMACMRVLIQVNLLLTSLNISWNKLRPKGAKHVAEGLAPNLALQYLDYAWCGMQDEGAEAFGAMLKTNSVSVRDKRTCNSTRLAQAASKGPVLTLATNPA